jgi:hypothetical protein
MDRNGSGEEDLSTVPKDSNRLQTTPNDSARSQTNPNDPSDSYFMTNCFVCRAVAKPDQVICFFNYLSLICSNLNIFDLK